MHRITYIAFQMKNIFGGRAGGGGGGGGGILAPPLNPKNDIPQ